MGDACPHAGLNSFNFMQFFGNIMQKRMLAAPLPSGELLLLSWKNTGSATALN